MLPEGTALSERRAPVIDGSLPGAVGQKAVLAFCCMLPRPGSLLALDLSRRRIGLAGTDAGRSMVTPLETLERRGMAADIELLSAICRERGVAALVIGLPLEMDGGAGPMARTMQGWARHLAAALDLPVLLQDERLTTAAVGQAIEEGRLARPKSGAPVDHFAAAVILEDALRAMRDLPSDGAPAVD
jgi:putative Holliday junction resolvase